MRHRTVGSVICVAVLAAGMGAAAPSHAWAAKPKIKVEYDKTQRFDGIRTWTWLEDPKVIHAGANPDIVQDARLTQESLSPPIKAAVEREMTARGYRLAAAGEKGDAQVAVYLIGSAGTSAQVLGQFLPYGTSWSVALGGYSPTQSMRIYETGTLIFDVIDPGKKSAVWRATATGEINRENSQEKRLAIIDEILRNILKKFPPK